MRASSVWTLFAGVLLALIGLGCGGEGATPRDTRADAGGASGADAGTGSGGTDAGDDGSPGADDAPASGTLSGHVSRTAAIPSGFDGVADLYIAVFDKNPIIDSTAEPLGNQLIEGADLSSADANVPYAVGGLPRSGQTVYVIAFLDVDGNGSADRQPHKPDLVTLENFGPITVMLSPTGTTTKDLILNAEMPF
jgi:hypothetical protein